MTAPLTGQAPGPRIVGAWSEDIVFEEATLKAQINPVGKTSAYRFEYGATEAYGSETPKLAVGSDSKDHIVIRFLEGLQPDTTYHYRIIATNADATNEGPDLTFTTYERPAANTGCLNQALRGGVSAALADCRAYEMVSPVDKNGGLGWWPGITQSTPAGNKLTYSAQGVFGDPEGTRFSNQHMATRGAVGWSSENIQPPGWARTGINVLDSSYFTFNEDLSNGWLYSCVGIGSEALLEKSILYRRDTASGGFENLHTVGVQNGAGRFDGASADLSHQVFQASNGGLTPDAAAGHQSQVYDLTGGEVRLVSVLPDGSANTDASSTGSAFVNVSKQTDALFNTHVVSEDGSRTFWTSYPSTFTGSTGIVYVRESSGLPESSGKDGEGNCIPEPGRACTVQLSSGDESRFVAASPDGSKILITNNGFTGEPELALVDVDTGAST